MTYCHLLQLTALLLHALRFTVAAACLYYKWDLSQRQMLPAFHSVSEVVLLSGVQSALRSHLAGTFISINALASRIGTITTLVLRLVATTAAYATTLTPGRNVLAIWLICKSAADTGN